MVIQSINDLHGGRRAVTSSNLIGQEEKDPNQGVSGQREGAGQGGVKTVPKLVRRNSQEFIK